MKLGSKMHYSTHKVGTPGQQRSKGKKMEGMSSPASREGKRIEKSILRGEKRKERKRKETHIPLEVGFVSRQDG